MGTRCAQRTWRIRGRSLAGDSDAYLTVTARGEQIMVSSPGGQSVAFTPRRAQGLRRVVGWAMAEALRGVLW